MLGRGIVSERNSSALVPFTPTPAVGQASSSGSHQAPPAVILTVRAAPPVVLRPAAEAESRGRDAAGDTEGDEQCSPSPTSPAFIQGRGAECRVVANRGRSSASAGADASTAAPAAALCFFFLGILTLHGLHEFPLQPRPLARWRIYIYIYIYAAPPTSAAKTGAS